MNAIETFIITRLDDAMILRRLIPLSRKSAETLQRLAMNFSILEKKELLIRLWQRDAKCLSELENKLRDVVGEWSGTFEMSTNDESPDVEGNIGIDKALLLQSISCKNHLLQAYAQLRRLSMSHDIRMLVQWHQVQALDVLERLTSIYLSYSDSK